MVSCFRSTLGILRELEHHQITSHWNEMNITNVTNGFFSFLIACLSTSV